MRLVNSTAAEGSRLKRSRVEGAATASATCSIPVLQSASPVYRLGEQKDPANTTRAGVSTAPPELGGESAARRGLSFEKEPPHSPDYQPPREDPIDRVSSPSIH
ncbi:hypothetical protein BaRGS_00002602 [Batillaria attramentaria]|uniref:Uncharacterized protein n=1 Tax=Batillaria attramentaria TaxID=370345 RepID=A0ABD0M1T7_9CAEN